MGRAAAPSPCLVRVPGRSVHQAVRAVSQLVHAAGEPPSYCEPRGVARPLTPKPLPTLGHPVQGQDESPMPDSAGEPSPRHKGLVRKVYKECPAEDKGRAE
jgi:hypothetical protein